MFESYINSLTDTEWLEFVFESAAIVSLPSAVCIDWAVTSIRDNRQRINGQNAQNPEQRTYLDDQFIHNPLSRVRSCTLPM